MTSRRDSSDALPSPQDSDPASGRNEHPRDPAAGDPAPLRLEPHQLPRRLELELPAPILARLEEMARACGRDLDEMALTLIDQQLSQGRGGASPEPDDD